METPPVVPRPPARAGGNALSWKLIAIGVLLAVLFVPLQMIDGVRHERLVHRRQAQEEVARSWGGEQLLAGPVLVVPYSYTVKVARQSTDARGQPVRIEETQVVQASGWFLPAESNVTGTIETSVRTRGVFTVPVYAANLRFKGVFQPNPAALAIDGATWDWSKARVVVALRHPRGVRAAPTLELAGKTATLEPGAPRPGWVETLEAPLALTAEQAAAGFEYAGGLTLNGSRSLGLAPVGGKNVVELRSGWADPSFGGASLPVAHEVGPEGFRARWEQSYFGRGYPQQWSDEAGRPKVEFAAIEGSAVRVSLLQPVDAYRLVERAIKYGLLFLVLVFANFFVFELAAGLRLHPVQYLLVGAALVLFFLGYLSLGEILPIGLAYAAAATASTGLVVAYSASVLRAGRRAGIVGAALAATYGYLYFILQLEDYALLAGTAALFALLAGVMWATRRIDFYGAR